MNDSDVIFCCLLDRYTVKVTEDHLSTIQVNTSKLDVYIKLVILDNEVEVATTQGKGHAVIPSFLFLKDFDPNEEKRPSSRACTFIFFHPLDILQFINIRFLAFFVKAWNICFWR